MLEPLNNVGNALGHGQLTAYVFHEYGFEVGSVLPLTKRHGPCSCDKFVLAITINGYLWSYNTRPRSWNTSYNPKDNPNG